MSEASLAGFLYQLSLLVCGELSLLIVKAFEDVLIDSTSEQDRFLKYC